MITTHKKGNIVKSEILFATCSCCRSEIEFTTHDSDQYLKFLNEYDECIKKQKQVPNFNSVKSFSVNCPECKTKVTYSVPEPVEHSSIGD